MNRLTQPFQSSRTLATILVFWVCPLAAEGQEDAHPLDPAIQMADASLQHIRSEVRDYTALFVKRCRVDGEIGDLQYAKVKIRNRKLEDGKITTPMGVYLNFLKPDSVKGREVIWDEANNNGKLVAHTAGFLNLMSVKLDPSGTVAMRGQRYPITEIGIEKITEKLLETGIRDRQYGECEVKFFRNAKVDEDVCTVLQVIHPVKRDYFDFHLARVYFSDALNMPIRYESWSWPSSPGGEPVLEEEYTYSDVKVNVGLTDRDFETSNAEYGFR